MIDGCGSVKELDVFLTIRDGALFGFLFGVVFRNSKAEKYCKDNQVPDCVEKLL
jgi:hypothetical protein